MPRATDSGLDGLHLGITPLGVAYSFACGWADLKFDGDKQVHGTCERGLAEAMREMALLQGFPPELEWSQVGRKKMWMFIGNAVPPPLGKAIFESCRPLD